jgi:hypothetical protein
MRHLADRFDIHLRSTSGFKFSGMQSSYVGEITECCIQNQAFIPFMNAIDQSNGAEIKRKNVHGYVASKDLGGATMFH